MATLEMDAPQRNLISFHQCSILHWVCVVNVPQPVKLLLDSGKDVNVRDGDNNTPLHYAVFSKCPNIVNLLLERGADINVANNYNLSPLQIAFQSYTEYTEDVAIRKSLLTHVVKLKVLHLYVSEDNLRLVLERMDETVLEMYMRCEKEVQAMKEDKVWGEFSLFEAMTSSVEDLLLFFKQDTTIKEVFKYFVRLDIGSPMVKYPVYEKMLLNHVQSVLKLITLDELLT